MVIEVVVAAVVLVGAVVRKCWCGGGCLKCENGCGNRQCRKLRRECVE